MHPFLRHVFAILVVGLSIAHLSGQSPKVPQNPPDWEVTRPLTQRPSFTRDRISTRFDGIEVLYDRLTCGKIELEVIIQANRIIRLGTSTLYSITIYDEGMPGTEIGIAVYKGSEFLPDLKEESMQALIRGLQKAHPGLQVVGRNSNIERKATPFVLNLPFQEIEYEITSSEGNTLKKRELFAFLEGSLLVFSLRGSQQDVDRNHRAFDQFLGDIHRPQ